jgi:molecular chaperone DnaJ
LQVKLRVKGSDCGGDGLVKRKVSQIVEVPKGIDTENTIRIPRKGGNNGDLIVVIEVGPHSYFKREGYDIHTTQLVTISQAVLGATIEVVTIDGKKKIQVRPGTSDGAIILITGSGIQRPQQNTRGNHCVHIKVKIPSSLNAKQQAAMKSYGELEDPIDPKSNI